uniref:MYND-type domain-containing protein n=1 Tax=Panagrellus redivivus TaxID=6233 RepID=A0A7E4VUZ5_PANRE
MNPMLTEAAIRKYISPEVLDDILIKYPDALKLLTEPSPIPGETAEEIHKNLVDDEQSMPSYPDKLETVARLAHMLLPDDFNKATYYEAALRSEVRLELTGFVTDMFTEIDKMFKKDEAHCASELNYAKITANVGYANTLHLIKEGKLKEQRDAIETEYGPKLREAKKERHCINCHKKAKAICCFYAAYCSKKCQKAHWVDHVLDCCRPAVKSSVNGADCAEGSGDEGDSAVKDGDETGEIGNDEDLDAMFDHVNARGDGEEAPLDDLDPPGLMIADDSDDADKENADAAAGGKQEDVAME